MATIKTTAKRNPITGDPSPLPAYARGSQTNFAGTDRKRTPGSDGLYTAGERNAKMQSDKALVKQLDDSFRASEKSKKTEARTKEKEKNSAYRTEKKDANQLQRDIKMTKRGKFDNGGGSKKGNGVNKGKVKIVKGGGPAKPPPMRKRDKSCQRPK
jgi:hypothetical protein